MVIMSCCIVIGAVDYLCGNRWGLGKRFTEGLEAFCPLFLMMGGILALVPLVEGYVAPMIAPLFRFIGTDPGVFPGMLLANDCGAYFLSESLADNRQAGDFGGMLVGAVVGVNVIFNLPVALGMTPEKDRGDVALGFLFGFVTLPIGCLFGGLTMGMPFILLLKQMLPVLMVSAVIGVMLKLYPNTLIKAFVVLGYKLYMDGRLIYDMPGEDYGEGTCQVPCYLKITAEYGTWAGTIVPEQLPAHFYVDYVRVYKEMED